ncbi:hypothetical protein [Jatrophihabitans sp.]|uniref:hypothetical protein n=1 Tax=Jatrophihabitans sp. TaxID=1932789 RepID=UPI0030C6BF85|nr:hypothetical protein [Jatrophihabitans sp.]
MTSSHGTSSPPPVAGGADQFDSHEAAELLVSTRRTARRGFEQLTPLVCVVAGVVLLAAYGTLWLSVRDQDPYVGPSGAAVAWVYGFVAVSALVSATAYRRAISGVHGQSRRDGAVAAVAVGVPWLAVYVFNGALHADGFGSNLVFGVFDAAGPWLVVGTGMAALAAGREQWGRMASGLVVVVIGTTAAFFGPAGCWGVLAVAGCSLLLVLAVIQYLGLRRP